MNLDILKRPSAVIKILAFFSSVIALSMFQTYSNDHAFINSDGSREVKLLGFCTIGAPISCFIMIYVLFSYFFDDNEPGNHFTLEVTFAVLLCILDTAVGVIVAYRSTENEVLKVLNYEHTSMTSGVFYLISALMHFLDCAILNGWTLNTPDETST